MTEPSATPTQRDPDLVNAEIALKRAAQRARDRARRAGIPLAYWEDGKLRTESPDKELDEESKAGG
jgi:hypothetical protein